MADRLPPGTREEFTELLVSCLPELYRLAHWLTRNPAAADDLVQEASYRAFRKFGSFERGTNFKAWVFRILHNHFLDTRRRARHEPRTRDFEDFEPKDPAQPAVDIELDPAELDQYEEHVDDAVREAVQELPENYRVVFLFFALGGMTYDEIAGALGIPIGTVMSRLFRARQRLSGKLVAYARDQGYLRRK
ncbi:MAG: sigma-70 family RNA polymerase sigma factor [Planctomycetes bacterium]|nr:sigma-70 family RNA polymerase sigma factor [Planctomycetota bacterium]